MMIHDPELGIVNRGNWARIKKVFDKARKGEAMTVGFLGGSITMGSVATLPERCYAYRVYDWFRQTFPNSEVTYVNAGIGATDSQFGCARVEEDLLKFQPDFVILEYSVNDDPNEHFQETYEGVLRKIYTWESTPAVMIVHNVFYDTGANTQLLHSKVARYYEIPAVSMQSTIYRELLLGNIENREITHDDLHPNDAGHALVASVITYYLQKIAQDSTVETESTLPATAMTQNAYENSVRYRNGNASPILEGFSADLEEQQVITDIFKNGWTATEKGASITFEVEGSCIAVQYRKTIHHPAPVANLILDDDEEHPFVLDANFNETWGDKLVLDTILDHGKLTKHKVCIRLTETHEEDKLPFYLVSVIGSGK